MKFTNASKEADLSWDDWAPLRHRATVLSFDIDEGCGFLTPLDKTITGGEEKNLFVHRSAILVEGCAHGRTALVPGQEVSFVISDDCCRALQVCGPDGQPIVLAQDSTLSLRHHTEQFRGPKPQQEDRWVGPETVGDLGQLFGIFDGHGGICSSEFLACNLHQVLRDDAAKRGGGGDMLEGEVHQLLRQGFLKADETLMQTPAFLAADDGSTGIVVLVTGHEAPVAGARGDVKLYVANIGDCRAVLCRRGLAVALSSDHKPQRPDEVQRFSLGRAISLSLSLSPPPPPASLLLLPSPPPHYVDVFSSARSMIRSAPSHACASSM